MLISDLRAVGNNLLIFRKKAGLTQAEVAELAGLSDRTYADIERGITNMRVDTLLRICRVLKITPDSVLTEDELSDELDFDFLLQQLDNCSKGEKNTAGRLLAVYLDSIK